MRRLILLTLFAIFALPAAGARAQELRIPAGVMLQRTVSELSRMAAASKRGTMPSMVLKM